MIPTTFSSISSKFRKSKLEVLVEMQFRTHYNQYDMKKETPHQRLCCQPKFKTRSFGKNISSERKSFILEVDKKWINGTVLTYFFIGGPESQRKVVRKAFQIWKETGIGLTFQEVTTKEEAMVRISFIQNNESWSYVGRDILQISKDKSTMNFGWPLDRNAYGMTTALHEIGHTLGFQHEHQNPNAGIQWDRKAVIAAFSGPPNHWNLSQIENNILGKIPQDQVKGSVWDWKSIMHYSFMRGLILQPAGFYQNGLTPPGILSQLDIEGVRSFYPPLPQQSSNTLQTGKHKTIKVKSGEQIDYEFTAPYTGKFVFETEGTLDTVMIVSEKSGNGLEYLSGDDDSGTQKNSSITLPLVKGRTYVVQLRVLYMEKSKSGKFWVRKF
jgi:hypothetical protein